MSALHRQGHRQALRELEHNDLLVGAHAHGFSLATIRPTPTAPHVSTGLRQDREARFSAVQEGHSLDEELEQFLAQKGRYSNGWVPLGEGTSDGFVRYDQIIEVGKNLAP